MEHPLCDARAVNGCDAFLGSARRIFPRANRVAPIPTANQQRAAVHHSLVDDCIARSKLLRFCCSVLFPSHHVPCVSLTTKTRKLFTEPIKDTAVYLMDLSWLIFPRMLCCQPCPQKYDQKKSRCYTSKPTKPPSLFSADSQTRALSP